MKKTLTVNLGGTVYHIDEDAYRLLDDYFSNLKLYFRKQEGAEEIVNDIENRISELFAEKVSTGSQVITIEYVEEVIGRMGKPEELAGAEEEPASNSSSGSYTSREDGKAHRRLFRNPDDKMLGGVVGGLAAYTGWDVSLLRLILLVVLICGIGTLIPVYLVCWLVIPEATTAAEKLNMRGEDVTIQNIGKTVTDGFEKVANGVNDFMRSDKPRTFFQKLVDVLVSIAGVILKVCLIVFVIMCSPILFVLAVVFIALVIAVVAATIGGGAALYSMFPMADWSFMSVSPITTIVAFIAGVLLVGIPLTGIVHAILCQVFKWLPMSVGLKWTLFILWFVALVAFLFCMMEMSWFIPYINA